MWQFIKFILVGVSNVVVSEGIYAALVIFGCHYSIAYTTGFVISVLNAYFWNNRFVFRKQRDEEKRCWWKVLLKTYLAYGFSFVLNLIVLYCLIDLLHISRWMGPLTLWCIRLGWAGATPETVGELAAEAFNILATTPLNFVINKCWTYKGTSPQRYEEG